jgi:hypothetical protein
MGVEPIWEATGDMGEVMKVTRAMENGHLPFLKRSKIPSAGWKLTGIRPIPWCEREIVRSFSVPKPAPTSSMRNLKNTFSQERREN